MCESDSSIAKIFSSIFSFLRAIRLELEVCKLWALSKVAFGDINQPWLPPLSTDVIYILVHTAKKKADHLGALFASNSTLDDRRTTPPTIPRCQSSIPEVKFNQKAVRRALSRSRVGQMACLL